MQPNYIDNTINIVLAFSGCFALFLMLLNAAVYGLTEGKGGPYVKQMVACLVATTVFVLSGIVKFFRWVF
jgi:hypothetical protein